VVFLFGVKMERRTAWRTLRAWEALLQALNGHTPAEKMQMLELLMASMIELQKAIQAEEMTHGK
jgi:hypothetical protein